MRITQAFFILLVVAGGCDELEKPNPGAVAIGVLQDITLYANSEAIIPIRDIDSPFALRIECTSKPKLGYVEPIPDGFKYTPYIDAVGNDELTFTFRNNMTNEEVWPPQTLKVIINPYTNTLDCKSVAVYDLVADDRLQQNQFPIEPVANDAICFDEYILSIYRPSAFFMPHRGQATIVEGDNDTNRKPYIIYQWEGPTALEDTITYKIIDKKDPGNVVYGLILVASAECHSTLRDDFETVTDAGSVTVDVLANDDLCSPVASTTVIDLIRMPRHGTIEQSIFGVGEWGSGMLPGVFVYQQFKSGTWSTDTVIYQYCDRVCSTATLVIRASQ